MANSEAETSSDAAQVLGGEYQVFLSFRGPDTRVGFTDFLYHELVDAGVHVFRDNEELRVGDVIDGSLLHAINNSKIYIPIFSQTYASSRWCLWELVHIVDNVSKSKGKKTILPIFLDVEPEDVKLKTPQYENDLRKHAKKFPDEVKAWRVALEKAGKIKGLNVKSSPAKIVKLVVEMVLEKLETKKETVTKHLLGLDNRVKHLIESLDVNNPDVRLIGIFGMGGIGKTTIAKVVYNQLSSHFGKCCSFLENVRERSSTEEGTVKLQKKLLLDVGSRSVEKVEDVAKGMKRIGETLGNKKVLVVLDDVHDKEHIKKLIRISKLYSGSRIIITTRDTTTLDIEGFIGEILRYEMQKMDDSLALQLFCQHAFGRDVPSNDFHKLSSEIVSLMGGLPLAIEVVSSLLKETKDEELWKEALFKLRKAPEEAILEKLKISYANLHKTQQQIFLDIACFFVNEKKTDATYIWADCYCYPVRGIKVLTERCLIKILQGGKLWMHDQLIALGRQIVRDESQDGLGKQSRLWIVEEALEIIKTKDRKDKVQALQIVRPSYNIEITNEEFERLQNLRCLKLNEGTYVGDFARCQSNLRWFSWHSPKAMDFRAKNLYLVHLVVCKLDDLNFKDDSKAWDLIKRSQNLKVLSMTSCYGITTIPDISRCLALEMLTLANCWNLKKIESFIGNLHSLIELKIEKCSNFTDLPEEVGALVKLKHFSLSGYEGSYSLEGNAGLLPSGISMLRNLEEQDYHEYGGLSYLKNLKNLQIKECDVLTDVQGLNELRSLQSLSVSKCPLLRSLIDAYRTNIPDDTFVQIDLFGDSIEDYVWSGRTSKHSIGEIFLATPYKVELPFTIIFVLGAEKKSEGFGFAGGIKRIKEDVTPGSVTYRELIADVEGYGFRMERMWYVAPGMGHTLLIEIKGDEQVNGMVQAASQKGFIDLYVEVGTDIRSQEAIIWASQRDSSVHLLLLLCAFFLSLLLSRVFPGKPHFSQFFLRVLFRMGVDLVGIFGGSF
ncbi:TMV resistance protein N-like [Eucalyptus grandis]|uniref:TMV resistance protein N-like n=1 Tax=Eucalyptus grandis TaxID=71139 RepID=UPI00192E7F23|nr:TMV resistance protein N-like [Eucalyptus grandis]